MGQGMHGERTSDTKLTNLLLHGSKEVLFEIKLIANKANFCLLNI